MQRRESGKPRPADIKQDPSVDPQHNDAVKRMGHWAWQATWTQFTIVIPGAIMLAIILWFDLR